MKKSLFYQRFSKLVIISLLIFIANFQVKVSAQSLSNQVKNVNPDLTSWQNQFQNIKYDKNAKDESFVNNTGMYSLYHANKWSDKGVYYPNKPSEEIIELRTKNSKTFRNSDGTNSAVFLSNVHYKDNSGNWKDIDFSLSPNKTGKNSDYGVMNTTNNFKTYIDANTETNGVIIEKDGYKYQFMRNRTVSLKKSNSTISQLSKNDNTEISIDNRRTINRKNAFSNIDEQIVLLSRGIEHGYFINSPSLVNNFQGGELIFSQEINIPEGSKVLSNNTPVNNNFTSEEFTIMMSDGKNFIHYSPVITYDGSVSYDEIMKRAEIPVFGDDNFAKANSYKSKYSVHFSGSKLIVTYSIPVNWLADNSRTYPLFVDPTVEVMSTPISNQINNGMPYNTAAHDQRFDFILPASELIAAGITAGSVIDSMAMICSSTAGMALNNFKIRTQPTTNTTFTSFTTTGWTQNYSSASEVIPQQQVWYGYHFSSTYIFDGTSNILWNVSRDNTSSSGTGGTYCRQMYSSISGYSSGNSTSTWPYDNSTFMTFNYLPQMRLNYTVCPTIPDPSPVTVNPTNIYCGGSSTLNATSVGNIIKWWDSSTAGTLLASKVSGANYIVNPTVTTTYYLESFNNFCTSKPRLSITLTVDPLPYPTSVIATPDSVSCGSGSALSAVSSGNIIRWWTSLTGGTMIGSTVSGASFNVNPYSTTTYYAESYNYYCAATPRISVSVTVVPLPAPISAIAVPSAVCSGGFTNLNATAPGSSIGWYTSTTGGILIGTSASGADFPVSGSSTVTYYAEAFTGGSNTQTFNYTGAVQSWIVPIGVTSVTVDVYGAQGGNSSSATYGTGGLGGKILSTITVTPGNTLYFYVGGQGGIPNIYSAGWNGGGTGSSYNSANYGGGGGGASDVRIGGSSLTNRVVVAGGGGGANGHTTYTQNNGGAGGGSIGGNGVYSGTSTTLSYCGYGGSQTAGGTSGTQYSVASGLGIGASAYISYYGAGGGGGYYGGGAGYNYGGGGGGSNYSATLTNSIQGFKYGNGEIILTWGVSSCTSLTRTSVTIIVTTPTAPTNVTATPDSVLCGSYIDFNANTSGFTVTWWDAAIGGNMIGTSVSGANFNYMPTATGSYYAEASSFTTTTQIFSYTMGLQSFTVPAGITSLRIDASGAQGGTSNAAYGTGGLGGRVQTTLAVSPGQTLDIYVGGQGSSLTTGGWNGGGTGGTTNGGGGGGASDIRIGGVSLSNRILVAGGGGGSSSYGGSNNHGGAGGGSASAGNGLYNNAFNSTYCGAGAALTTGGTGATGGAGGGTGMLGIGGNGVSTYGAGGGGGLFGGGGSYNYGGGGGGSSWVTTVGTTNTTNTQGYKSGDGQISITWTSLVCSSTRVSVSVIVNSPLPLPTNLIATPSTITCGTSADLTAVSTGNIIRWWDSPTGGTMFGTSASGGTLTVYPNLTTTYYAESFNICAGNSRVSIVITVNVLSPPSLAVASPSFICSGGFTNFNAISTGNGIYWWDSLTGGTLLGASLSGANFPFSANSNTTLYAETYAGGPGSLTFMFTGAYQTFTVPVGVNLINVDVAGAQGGTYNSAYGAAGLGGRVQSTLTVSPGQSLYVYVGGKGSPLSSGGWNGGADGGISTYYGGGGGGASDIRIGSTAVTSRVIVAGGGGGASGYTSSTNSDGGAGGGLIGVFGLYNGNASTYYCGQGGTQIGQGASATGGSGTTLGSEYGRNAYSQYGGGGGGGFFGGGGGYWGGGGGGSNYDNGNSSAIHTQGYQSGDGQVIITWNAPVCSSSSRSSATVSVSIPTTATNVIATPSTVTCGNTTDLSASSNGFIVTWWDALSGGTMLGTSADGANFNIMPTSNTTYYAETNSFGLTSQVFNYSGSNQTFIIPSGMTSIIVDASGAQGFTTPNGSGGKGGRVQTLLTVTPGQLLNIYVGQQGLSCNTGGWNGGAANVSCFSGSGNGGGSSDIRIGGTGLVNRVIVAGGGGGGSVSGYGGSGGGLTGGNGYNTGTSSGEGLGGDQITGGSGGIFTGYTSGSPGTIGIGGVANTGNGGGGGGGGYYGGGGGCWSGGGGGSSWVITSGSSGTVHTQGYKSGNGQIIISWNAIGSILCNSSSRVSVNVSVTGIPLPTSITASPSTIVCSSSSTLNAVSSGNIIRWWDAPIGGNFITSTASGINYIVVPTTTTTYYAEVFNLCVSQTRASITVIVNPAPAPTPVTASKDSMCSGVSSDLNATSTGNLIRWWDSPTGGTLIGSSSSGSNYTIAPTTTTTYYAETVLLGGGGTGTATFTYTGAIQSWTVPTGITSITIDAQGAAGGYRSGAIAGKGSRMVGTFTVTPGSILSILVGQSPGLATYYPAGGGGTFVALGSTYSTATPLIVAGGGGGAYSGTGVDASTSTSGTGLNPGTSGNGAPSVACGGGGGGFYSSGGNDTYYGYAGGKGFHQGGAGGIGNTSYQSGGFGGGAVADYASSCNTRAGAGGGYSGGSGTTSGAQIYIGQAGGSYNGGTNQTNTAGYQTGNGQVNITWSAIITTGCISPTRTSVTVSIVIPPNVSNITTSSTIICGNSTTLSATSLPFTLSWWNASTGGTLLFTSASGGSFIVTPTTTTTYYAEANTFVGSSIICSSTGRISVTVTVNAVPDPSIVTATPSMVTCSVNSDLNASTTNGIIKWWDSSIGGNILGTSASASNFSVIPTTTTTYYAEAFNNLCSSLLRVSVTVIVNPLTISSLTATPSIITCGNNSDLNATTSIGLIKWWDSSTGGIILGTSASASNFSVTPTTTTTYYAEASTSSGLSGSQTFNFTGSKQTFTIPSGISSIFIDASGAQGFSTPNGTGGLGGRVQTTLIVSPSQILNIFVGQQGLSCNTGGWNGGAANVSCYSGSGNGGGSSDIRIGGTALINRVIVAGGGGGASIGGYGGSGGGLTGGNGYQSGTSTGGGQGGSQTGGGQGGIYTGYTSGSLGLIGIGGTANSGNGGGGGGGGYFGGGGGCNDGGGGGGSSWVTTTGISGTIHNQGFQSGNGRVIIIWNASLCTSITRVSVTVIVNPITNPANVIATPSIITCNGNSNLTATSTNGIIKWWDASTGGNLLYTSISGGNYNVNPTINTTYYAESSNTLCTSASRISITVTFSVAGPTANAYASTLCSGGLTNLNATSLTSTNVIKWWDSSTGGNLIGSSMSGINFTLFPTLTTYYADANSSAPLCSTLRTPVNLIYSTPTNPTNVIATPSNITCGITSDLIASSNGFNVTWWDSSTGGNLLGTSQDNTNFTVTPTTTTTYYAEANTFTYSTQTFNYLQYTQTWTIPSNVTTLLVDASGGQGGAFDTLVGNGGLGGRVETAISVTPGQIIYIKVGGGGYFDFTLPYGAGVAGSNGGGCGSACNIGLYGGGGGGASDVRIGGQTFSNRVIVAGGGGGAGWNGYGNPAHDLHGGAGGGLIAGNGYYNGGFDINKCGSGGTQVGGGLPSTGGGYPGTLGNGGFSSANFSEGGGGGGYYGGGGGSWYGGGGGGSSYVTPIGTSNTVHTQGYKRGDGIVIFRWKTILCSSPNRVSLTVTVSQLPNPTSISANPTSISCGSNTNITATTTTGLIRWWDSSTGGNLIGTSTSNLNLMVFPLTTTTYYAESYQFPCASTLRISVTVTVIPIILPPTSVIANPSTFNCIASTSNLSAVSSGNIINWWDSSVGGLLIGSSISGGNLVVSPTITTSYYAEVAQSNSNLSQIYNYTGSSQTWIVPFGTNSVNIDASGAQGFSTTANSGGKGGRVQTTLSVSPGQTLNIYVGQSGLSNNTGGWNGGAGNINSGGGMGGGASDIRIGGSSLNDRIIIAGGGGGASSESGAFGGLGGGLTAGNGYLAGTGGGYGGTISNGGIGGVLSGYISGANGIIGIGGTSDAGNTGGGGGGGYYGGGGGCNGGGGGGSSWVDTLLTLNTIHTQGFQSGDGQVTLSWINNSSCPSIRVSVTITVNSSSIATSSAISSPASTCGGSPSTLSLTGGSPGDGNWYWYSGTCGGTLIGSGNTNVQSPTTTTTYYVRGESSCNTTNCLSTTVSTNATNSTMPSSITASQLNICQGITNTLDVIGGTLSVEANWYWYSGSCGGTLINSGATLYDSPNNTTLYFVRGEGSCNTTSCVSIEILVDATSILASSITSNSANPCNSTSTTLSLTGGTLGTNASWNWYSGSCGGTNEGNSSTLVIIPTSTVIYYVRAEGLCNTTTCLSIETSLQSSSVSPTSAIAFINTVCNGSSTTLGIIGGSLGAGASWYWYSNTCGGTTEGNGSALTISPTISTAYFVRAEGTCNTTSCVSLTIEIGTPSTDPTLAISTPSSTCSGVTVSLSTTGGVLGVGANWFWYSGSCGGVLSGSGVSVNVSSTITTDYFVRAEGACNTTTCANVQLTITPPLSTPVSANCTPDTITSGQSTTLNVNDTLSLGEYWSWYQNSCNGTFIGTGTSIVLSPTTTTTYFVKRDNGTCYSTCISTQLIIPGSVSGYTITGTFTYGNNSSTPLDSVWVYLMLNGNIVDSMQADINGDYIFTQVPDGIYNITATTHKPWSGVNITDVVKIKKHFAGSIPFTTSYIIHAGDVNKSYLVNVTDGVKTARRFAGSDTSFIRGDWDFEKPLGGDTLNVSTYMNDTIIVSGANVTQDFKGICIGDVNGSYNPLQGAKSAKVQITNIGIKKLNSNEYFDLPISVNGNLSVGAISLILNYPKNLLDIENVQMLINNKYEETYYHYEGSELRIGWVQNEEPIIMNNNESYVIIRLKTKGNFNIGDVINITVVNNELCELADGNGEPYNNVIMNTYSIEHISSNSIDNVSNKLNNELNVYPIPANERINVKYNIVDDGVVLISIYNVLGEKISDIVNASQIKGSHNSYADLKAIPAGIYTIKMTVDNKSTIVKRIVISR